MASLGGSAGGAVEYHAVDPFRVDASQGLPELAAGLALESIREQQLRNAVATSEHVGVGPATTCRAEPT